MYRRGPRRRGPTHSGPVRPQQSEGSSAPIIFEGFSEPAFEHSTFSGPSGSVHLPEGSGLAERENAEYQNQSPVRQSSGQARPAGIPRPQRQQRQNNFSGSNQFYPNRPPLAPVRIDPQPRIASPEREPQSPTSSTGSN